MLESMLQKINMIVSLWTLMAKYIYSQERARHDLIPHPTRAKADGKGRSAMLKKFITVIVFLVLIAVAGYFESHYITHSFDDLVGKLNEIKTELSLSPDAIDTPENVGNLIEIHEFWQTRTQVLKFFVWHTGIKDVEVGLARITSYTEENNYTEAYVELNNLIDYCEHYKEDYRFSLQNII